MPRDGHERFAECKATVARMAAESFAKHVVTRTEQGDYRCAAPGTWMHGFIVIVRPSYLIVYGDIGDWVLQHSDRSGSLGWLRGAARDWDYLIGKVRAGKEEGFYPGDVVDWIGEQVHEEVPKADALLADVNEAIKWAEFHRAKWHELLAEHDFDDCWDVGTRPAAGMLWMTEALRWFVEHVDQVQPQEAASGG